MQQVVAEQTNSLRNLASKYPIWRWNSSSFLSLSKKKKKSALPGSWLSASVGSLLRAEPRPEKSRGLAPNSAHSELLAALGQISAQKTKLGLTCLYRYSHLSGAGLTVFFPCSAAHLLSAQEDHRRDTPTKHQTEARDSSTLYNLVEHFTTKLDAQTTYLSWIHHLPLSICIQLILNIYNWFIKYVFSYVNYAKTCNECISYRGGDV